MKTEILEKQLEFDFMKKEDNKFRFGIRDLIGLVTFTAVGLGSVKQ